jgi:hypothetical protein
MIDFHYASMVEPDLAANDVLEGDTDAFDLLVADVRYKVHIP